jgi:hypothetical protein
VRFRPRINTYPGTTYTSAADSYASAAYFDTSTTDGYSGTANGDTDTEAYQ